VTSSKEVVDGIGQARIAIANIGWLDKLIALCKANKFGNNGQLPVFFGG
jgi:hypothetical protein